MGLHRLKTLFPQCASDLNKVVELHPKLIVGLRTRSTPLVQPSAEFLTLVIQQSEAIANVAAALKT